MFKLNQGELFIPGSEPIDIALSRTTHLAIAAHQDDIEIMAIDGILQCSQSKDQWFSGVVMTDGRSSPRSGSYIDFTDEEMVEVRNEEQRKAATIGSYSALIMLGYQSAEIKTKNSMGPVEELKSIFMAMEPKIVYLHNLADKHPTHVATALRALEALRLLGPESMPERVFGCEVWRGLDWTSDRLKVLFNCSKGVELQKSLLSVFESQNNGGKRYDLATMGRRLSNATFLEAQNTDKATHITFGMDLTPLVSNPEVDIKEFVLSQIEQFKNDIQDVFNLVN